MLTTLQSLFCVCDFLSPPARTEGGIPIILAHDITYCKRLSQDITV